MDRFRSEAWDEYLKTSRFLEPLPAPTSPQSSVSLTHKPLSLITIRKFGSETKFDEEEILMQDIVKHMGESGKDHENEKASASLMVVLIDSPFHKFLNIEQQVFVDLLKVFNTDVYCQHLLTRSTSDIYQSKHFEKGESSRIQSFYIYQAAAVYKIIGSYTPTGSATRAIMISCPNGLQSADAKCVRFSRTLRPHQDLIDSPTFLPFIGGLEVVKWMGITLGSELRRIETIKEETGYATWLGENLKPRSKDTAHLGELSTRTGISLHSYECRQTYFSCKKSLSGYCISFGSCVRLGTVKYTPDQNGCLFITKWY